MLLVTSSRNINHWIVPGGGVDPGEEPAVTAVREVLEEAGVVGNLGRSLGVFEVIVDWLTETVKSVFRRMIFENLLDVSVLVAIAYFH